MHNPDDVFDDDKVEVQLAGLSVGEVLASLVTSREMAVNLVRMAAVVAGGFELQGSGSARGMLRQAAECVEHPDDACDDSLESILFVLNEILTDAESRFYDSSADNARLRMAIRLVEAAQGWLRRQRREARHHRDAVPA